MTDLMTNFVLKIAIGCAVVALTACTTVPTQLEGDYAAISPARVDPGDFGQPVRWGGVIVGARNEADRTCFEILSRELGSHLRPKLEDRTAGRFIACKQGFFDPEVFAKGREVTLTGRIGGIEERKIEEFDYRYPVIDIDDIVLWEQREDVVVYRDPFYDPFWSPYYWGQPYWGHWPYYWYPPRLHGPAGEVRKTLPDPAQIDGEDG